MIVGPVPSWPANRIPQPGSPAPRCPGAHVPENVHPASGGRSAKRPYATGLLNTQRPASNVRRGCRAGPPVAGRPHSPIVFACTNVPNGAFIRRGAARNQRRPTGEPPYDLSLQNLQHPTSNVDVGPVPPWPADRIPQPGSHALRVKWRVSPGASRSTTARVTRSE